jgi:hypothetical protein
MTLLWLFRYVESPAKTISNWVFSTGAGIVKVTEPSDPVVPVTITTQLRWVPAWTWPLPSEIYFQHRDGTWEGDVSPDQIVLEKVLRLDPLRARISRAAQRPAKVAGRVEKHRGMHASAPVFAGTRIRVSTVQATYSMAIALRPSLRRSRT